MRTRLGLAASVLLLLLPVCALAQGATVSHLTVYDAGVAEFLEERTIDLQPGLNQIEWRSLMPKAFIRTLRIVVDDAEVVRQDVTYDGNEVRNQRSPVLHLVIRNRGAAGPRRVQIDYLAPDLSWRNDYSLVLDPTPAGAPPASGTLDAWVSLYNSTGTDMRAGTVDLVAGEIALLVGGAGARPEYAANIARQQYSESDDSPGTSATEATAVSAFTRFRLGRDVSLTSNAPVNRLPLFQRERLSVVQRNVFENEYGTQTLARGGFQLLPRGLEVRLVSKNPTDASMPAGQVTIYARVDGLAQVVGQDTVQLTPPGGEFSVTQGRSSTLFGTRRVLERRFFDYTNEQGHTRQRLVTKVEVVLTNRGPRESEAFVRESVEPSGENVWKILESSAEAERLAANTFQMRVKVPAGGRTVVTYTVETK